MKNLKLTICCISKESFEEARNMFSDVEDVKVVQDSLLTQNADAIVSPANSFGIMDGGIDKEITEQLGLSLEIKLKQIIADKYFGELSIGDAVVVTINKPSFKYMIAAPTMRVPMNVSQTTNAYIAFRAMLIAALKHESIESIATPMFCTGIGKMNYKVAATQMKIAYRNIIQGMRIVDYDVIYNSQIKLLNPDYTGI